MKILPTFAVAGFIFIVLLIFYLKSDNESTKYICIEDETSNYLFMKLEKTNFLSNLTSNKDGNFKYELFTKESGIYNYSIKNENDLIIFKNEKVLEKGHYSFSNNNLLLKLKERIFKGKCTLHKDHCINNITH